MCRSIKTLHNFEPPATDVEIRASALQFVRKAERLARPSKTNQPAFDRAVEQVTAAATRAARHAGSATRRPRDREVEAAKARLRAPSVTAAQNPNPPLRSNKPTPIGGVRDDVFQTQPRRRNDSAATIASAPWRRFFERAVEPGSPRSSKSARFETNCARRRRPSAGRTKPTLREPMDTLGYIPPLPSKILRTGHESWSICQGPTAIRQSAHQP